MEQRLIGGVAYRVRFWGQEPEQGPVFTMPLSDDGSHSLDVVLSTFADAWSRYIGKSKGRVLQDIRGIEQIASQGYHLAAPAPAENKGA